MVRFLKLTLSISIFLVLLNSCKNDEESCCGPLLEDYFPIENSTWETLSPNELNWNNDSLESLYSMLENNDTRAFIVLKNGKIVIEKYWGKNIIGTTDFDKDTKWYWASAAKTLTAFTVQKAAQHNYLKLSDTSSKYLGSSWTSLPSAKEEKITIWNQLTMTTGLDDTKGDAAEPLDLTYAADAGTRWAYHNAPYTLLEKVVSNATSQDFNSYFNENLQDVIGMTGVWQWSGDNHLYLSDARSAARFGLLMMHRGRWDRCTLLSETEAISATSSSQQINPSYGYLWWLNGQNEYMLPQSQFEFSGLLIPNAPLDSYSAIGKNGQYISVSPEQGLVVIRMGENPNNALAPILFLNDIWKNLGGAIGL